jgi:Flp pilus assembly protein TadG
MKTIESKRKELAGSSSLARSLRTFARAQIGVVLALASVTLVGVMALGVDASVMYYNWVRSQKATDAAAVAGANYLTGYAIASSSVASGCTGYAPDNAKEAACTYAVKNGLSANNLTINEPGTGLSASAPKPNIQVVATKTDFPYMFARVLGLNTYSIKTVSTAKASGSISGFNGGLYPVVFQCKAPCTSINSLPFGNGLSFGQKFTANANGNWGWLNVGQGPGGSALRDAIANGYNTNIKVGDSVGTDTGAKWGPVSQGFSTRMANHNAMSGAPDPNTVCSGTNPAVIPPNDPLLVTLPVADISSCSGSCSGISVQAFVDVYLVDLSKSGPNIAMTACFVQVVTPGGYVAKTSGPNLGAIVPPTLIQ